MPPTDDARVKAFSGYVDEFVAYLADVRRLSSNTVRAYACDLDAFVRWLGRSGADPLSLTPRDLRRYLGELSRAQYSTRTINRHLSALRGLYRWLVAREVTSADAVAAVMSPKIAKTLPKTMADDDVRRMFDTCDVSEVEGLRDRAFLELLYASGARVSETSAIDLKDFDAAQKQLRLFGKGSKERIVPLYDEAVRWVERYVREARPSLAAKAKRKPVPPALFLSVRGNRMSADALRTCFERHARVAGVDATLATHAMRHTYATELLGGGADLRSVQELLGHASLSTTQIYTHLSVERLKEAARQAHPRGE